MGQKFNKYARGAYDAIVYIEGSEVVAEDANGRKIASGVAGVDDDEVRDAAISFLATGGKLVFAGKHQWATQPTWPANISVEGYAKSTEISLLADITPFYVENSDGRVSNIIINTCSGQTKGILCVAAITSLPRRVQFDTITINAVAPHSLYNAIELVAGTGKSLAHIDFSNVIASYCNHLLYIDCTADDAWINTCKFDRLYAVGFVTLVELVNASSSTSDGNIYTFVQGQVFANTVDGFVIDGKFNTFVGCHVWDWVSTGHPLLNRAWYFSPDSSHNTVIGPLFSEWSTTTGENCINLGVKNNFIVSDRGIFASKSIVTVGAGIGCDYSTLYDAIVNISNAIGSPNYIKTPIYIIVDGPVVETSASVIYYSGIEIIGINNATISGNFSHATSLRPVLNIYNGVNDITLRNIKLINTGNDHSIGLQLSGNSNVNVHNCTFESTGGIGSLNTGVIAYGSTVAEFYNCKFKGGKSATGNSYGCLEASGANINATYYNCKFEGGGASSGYSGGFSSVDSCSRLYNCTAICGSELSVVGFSLDVNGSFELHNCRSVPKRVSTSFVYSDDDDGRFQPFVSSPWQLIEAHLLINVAHSGFTIDIGTTPGGNDVASGISISTIGRKTFSYVKTQLLADGYLYVTPSSAISVGDITLYYSAIYNYTGGYACRVSSDGPGLFDNCSFVSNGASHCLFNAVASPKFYARNCVFYTHGSQNSIYSSPTISGTRIMNSVITSQVVGVTGIDGKSSGSSTGTGSEQTIAHGLASAPSKAYIYIPSTGEMVGVASDATNIYPNIPSSIAYYWHAEV